MIGLQGVCDGQSFTPVRFLNQIAPPRTLRVSDYRTRQPLFLRLASVINVGCAVSASRRAGSTGYRACSRNFRRREIHPAQQQIVLCIALEQHKNRILPEA